MTREKLLMKLSAAQFALWELHVYLDTHHDDATARELHEDYAKKFQTLRDEFEKDYGPLTLDGKNSDEWLKNPWPWDYTGEEE